MRAVVVKSYSAAVWKFRIDFSRFLPRLAVSHGGAKLIELRSPRHGDFEDSGQTKHYSRLHDRDVGSRHATSHAVADTAHPADQINVQVSRACRQASVQSASLWADSAYRSDGIEEKLAKRGLKSRIHRRAYRNRKLNEAQKAANTARSKVRARVEHVFGDQKNGMGAGIVRTIGIVRARCKIGMTNLVYNMRRFVCLERMAAAG